MNKLIVISLAVCLVSVHAFVKRDTAPAPATDDNKLNEFTKTLQGLSETVAKQAQELFDTEKLKKTLDETLDKVNQQIEEWKKNTATSQDATKQA